MIVVSDKLSTESFHAFIDEQLTDEQYVQVEAQLDEIPEKIEEIQQCHIINERLREVFDPVVEEHIPDDLYELALYGVADEPEEDDPAAYVNATHFGYDYDDHAPMAPSGYEQHIETPLDSMDAALELQDEEFIEDNEFADLAAMSDAAMADFDIDAMGGSNNDIIPDIFDQPEHQANEYQPALDDQAASADTAEDMLDSLDNLALEPEADLSEPLPATEAPVPHGPIPQPTRHKESAPPIEPPDYELESLDDEPVQENTAGLQTPASAAQQQPQPGPAASEHVLDTLAPEEELTLEPLDDDAESVTIESTEPVTDIEPPAQTIAPAAEAQEPSAEAQEPSAEAQEEPSGETKKPSARAQQLATEIAENFAEAERAAATHEPLPDDVVEPSAKTAEPSAKTAEPSAETTEPSAETTESSAETTEPSEQPESAAETQAPSTEQTDAYAVKEAAEEASQPSTDYEGGDGAASIEAPADHSRKVLGGQPGETTAAEQTSDDADIDVSPVSESPLHTDDQSVDPVQQQADATQINYHAAEAHAKGGDFPVDEIAEELDTITDDPSNPNHSTPNDVVAEFFAEKRANPDFEVHEVVREFEEVSEEFDHQPPSPMTDDLYVSPVDQIKSKASGFFANLKRKFARNDADSVPDFNAPPSFETYAPPPASSADDDIPHISEFFNDERTAPKSAPDYGAPAHQEPYPAEQPTADALETMASEPALDNAAGAEAWGGGVDGQPEFESPDSGSHKIGDTLRHYKEKLSNGQMVAYDAGGELAPLERYKQRVTHWYSGLTVENRGTIGGVILLFVGLLVGASAMSLMETPAPPIGNDKVEQLAIDAHILYTQQDQNFAGESNTSITESMQWLSARIGKLIRLADVKMEGFKHERAIVMPTMVNYATANIFANKDKQKMTLFITASTGDVTDSPLSCRIPTAVDGLCSWIQDSVQYVVVANLSLSRVRAFSQELIQQL